MTSSHSWLPPGPVPTGGPPAHLLPYLRHGSPWGRYLQAFLAGRPGSAALVADLDWLTVGLDAFEEAGSDLGHPLRGAGRDNRAARHQYQQVLARVEPHLHEFVREYGRQTGLPAPGRGATGFRAARLAEGVPPEQVADTIHDTAQRLTLWAAELTEASVRCIRVFAHGDGSTALVPHDALLRACTDCRSAVRAWRAARYGAGQPAVDQTYAAMCRADEEFARTVSNWFAHVRKDLQRQGQKLERAHLDLFHTDLQRMRVAGEAVRTVLLAASAVLAFTPAAAVTAALSAIAGLLAAVDRICVEATVRHSVRTDQQILDHVGLVPDTRAGSLTERAYAPTSAVRFLASAGGQAGTVAHGLAPGQALRSALAAVGDASVPLGHTVGAAAAVVELANAAVHTHELRHPQPLRQYPDSDERRDAAGRLLAHREALRADDRSGRVPPAAEQVWRNALRAADLGPWLAAAEGLWLQNPLHLPMDSVMFDGVVDGCFAYTGTLVCDVHGSRHEVAGRWTLTPEGVLHVDEATWAALGEAAGACGPPRAGTHPAPAEEKTYTDFAAAARDDDFLRAGYEVGWLGERGLNEHHAWPTETARAVVGERLHHILIANETPDAPHFADFVRHADLTALYASGRTHRWLTEDGQPDESYPCWTGEARTALTQRLRLGR
ncbi:hypothetical protein ABT278_29380 [Streptomyces sp. NPDC001228]|uniref:hypothetical protein n=1 Tax=Streptomyces sp. NPDC001228 TaxID=3154381 RepID=UPI003325A092